MKIYIHGSSGRLGTEVARRAAEAELTICAEPQAADCWVLAVPTAVAPDLIEAAAGRTVIDLSGALKQRKEGRLAWLDGEGLLLDGQPPRHGDRLANPGCFAGSVIVGMTQARLVGTLRGAVHVAAVGGRSTAHKSQEGGLRLARRLLDHPHADEVMASLPGVTVDSFSLMVAYQQPHGILSVISGRCEAGAVTVAGVEALEVGDVLGTPEVRHRLQRDGERFTLGVVLDNIVFPAENAVRLVRALSILR